MDMFISPFSIIEKSRIKKNELENTESLFFVIQELESELWVTIDNSLPNYCFLLTAAECFQKG
ncbi:hypothetical protein D0T50_03365 [Bacteroides sp. 214]|nr:hypothetical protein [Bacteroides sp. 214]